MVHNIQHVDPRRRGEGHPKLAPLLFSFIVGYSPFTVRCSLFIVRVSGLGLGSGSGLWFLIQHQALLAVVVHVDDDDGGR